MTPVPPEAIDAEQAVLACLLFGEPDTLDIIEESGFRKEFFYREAHLHIYIAMKSLREAGIGIDAVTLAHRLRSDNTYDLIGGAAYIMALGDIVPGASDVLRYTRLVHQKAIEREMQSRAYELFTCTQNWQGTTDELLARAEEAVEGVRELWTPQDSEGIGDQVHRALESLKGEQDGVMLGFASLDSYIAGIQRGELVIVGALPGAGKTALALTCLYNITSNAIPGSIFNFEMSPERLIKRLMAQISGVNSRKFRYGVKAFDEADAKKVAQAAISIAKLPLHVADTRGVDLGVLKSKIRRRVKKHGARIIFIDYLGKIRSKEWQSEERELADRVDQIKSLALELDISIVLLSQLNRAVRSRLDKTPTIGDLRGSGRIEAEADVILLLNPVEDDFPVPDEPTLLQVIIGKNRDAETGMVQFAFDKARQRFRELDSVHKEEEDD